MLFVLCIFGYILYNGIKIKDFKILIKFIVVILCKNSDNC